MINETEVVMAFTVGDGIIQIIYTSLYPNGSMKLYEFIAIVTGAMIILSQLPTFHSLRHLNLGSLLLSLGYAFFVVAACIIAGTFYYFFHNHKPFSRFFKLALVDKDLHESTFE